MTLPPPANFPGLAPPPPPQGPLLPMPGLGVPPMMMHPSMAPQSALSAQLHMGKRKGKGPQPLDKWANVSPNNTVYVNNLNEKINREDLLNGLREVFGQYGDILQVVCYTKIKKCKGQAWIVFDKVESAVNAVKELQNFMFFDKPLRVAFSLNISDATLKKDGKEPPERVRPEKKKKSKKAKDDTQKKKKKRKKKGKDKDKEKDGETNAGNENENAPQNQNGNQHMKGMDGDMKMTDVHHAGSDNDFAMADREKERSTRKAQDNNNTNNPTTRKRTVPRRQLPPNKTLFLEGLPWDATAAELIMIFQQYRGFERVRLIESKPGIAFVDFVDAFHSSPALEMLHGLNLRGHTMQVSFAAQ